MRAKEFLLEYDRNKTASQTSQKIVDALVADNESHLPMSLMNIQNIARSAKARNITHKLDMPQIMNLILAAIEEKDYSPNKKYVPWLARMYAKGGVKFEDLNRNNMLGRFEEAKRLNLVPAEHKDINRFKDYREFETLMRNEVIPKMEEESENEGAKAKKVFEDETVLVVVPENEAAACKYGRQTQWCTAATQGKNYFDEYNKDGPLYILIPKNPEYEGEKYQLHFESNSYMNEEDDEVNLRDLLTRRFPSLDSFFAEQTKEEVKQDKYYTRFYTYRELHREDGPAVIANDDTEERWFKYGELHREDGPAVILYDQSGNPKDMAWLLNGVRHRLDGPAYIQGNGNKEWWIFGKKFPNEKEFNQAVEKYKKTGKIT